MKVWDRSREENDFQEREYRLFEKYTKWESNRTRQELEANSAELIHECGISTVAKSLRRDRNARELDSWAEVRMGKQILPNEFTSFMGTGHNGIEDNTMRHFDV